ncbi:MAG: hypothetical protein D4R84_09845, partial [Rhodocyclaceae bacterium]
MTSTDKCAGHLPPHRLDRLPAAFSVRRISAAVAMLCAAGASSQVSAQAASQTEADKIGVIVVTG